MKRALILVTIVLLLAGVSLSVAQGSRYTLDWWTVDGGGGASNDGRHALQATIGQPDAGQMGDGRYTLLSGYWDGSGRFDVYLPLVTRP